jgi:TolB-like protein
MKPILNFLKYLAAALLVAALVSCSFKEPPAVLKSGPLPADGALCRLAIMPFSNQSSYAQAANIFGRVFTSMLIESGNYMVAQEGDVRKILQQQRLLPGQQPNVEEVRTLADRLGVQAVITGAVVEMRDKTRYGRRLDPSLAVIVRILDADSGRTLWTTYNRSEGKQYRKLMHFGLVNSLTELSERVAGEIMDTWQEEGFKKCTE